MRAVGDGPRDLRNALDLVSQAAALRSASARNGNSLEPAPIRTCAGASTPILII
jgi:hypothetical protein